MGECLSRSLPRGAAAVLALLAAATSVVGGQALPPDPAEGARMRIGPFAFNPSIEATNIGNDDNVFNEAENPKSDFTATLSPALQVVMRGGPARATYGSRVDYVWFREYASERSTNSRIDGKLEFRFTRLVPYVSGGLTDTRERPSAEIDERAGRRETRLAGGAAVVLGPAAVLAVGVRQQRTNFDADEFSNGVSLEQQLDERLRAFDAELRVDLTPLTTFSMKGTAERQRFTFVAERNSKSFIVTPSLELNPSALVAGRLSVGYRRFDAADPRLPDFSGVMAHVDLTHLLTSMTKIQGQLTRDVQYSFELNHPYYLGSGVELTVTQQIGGPFDVQVTAGRQRLDYRSREAAGDEPVLRVNRYGGGVGVRVREQSRLSVNVDINRRRGEEDLPGRDYDRRRVYASLSYGF